MSSKDSLPSPCFVCEEILLENNLKLLKYIQDEANVNILLALKGFALYSTFNLCKKYLKGCCASGLNEALLAKEEFGGEVHTYSPAFKPNEFEQITQISNHIVFNSFSQLELYKNQIKQHNSIGLRINPEVSTVDVDIYNPCAIYSRLGITKNNFQKLPEIVDGLHFHALCEQNIDDLEKVLNKFEKNFSQFFSSLKWINFGGGHHITREDYDVERLIVVLKEFKRRFPNLKIYLEPGEAIGWKTGYLESTILDIVTNDINIVILDTSAEAHMPDTLAMPYRADIRNSGKIDEKKYNYRLAGNTCLAGDIIGDYSFDNPLKIGDKIILEDMIHYTMVKTTTFNGINLPSIAIKQKNGTMKIVKNYGYESYKDKLS
ncbi:MAG: carboxynorspermidine decarboxylase [Epsilonproteobacteria bacterium]|nr:MAG: carboxynorspermidine decarboxylase [Campylobacterota bacterium]